MLALLNRIKRKNRAFIILSATGLLLLSCTVMHYVKPMTLQFQNKTTIPFDSMYIERNVSLGKWGTAFLYGKTWISNDATQKLKVNNRDRYKFGPTVIFSFPAFRLEYSEGVTLGISLPADTTFYSGNDVYQQMLLGLNCFDSTVLSERKIQISMTRGFLPAMQQFIETEDSIRVIKLSYRAYVPGKNIIKRSVISSEDTNITTLGRWTKHFELHPIPGNNDDSLQLREVRFVNTGFGSMMIYTTENDIPCNLLYKVVLLSPARLKEFKEEVSLSCRLSDSAFKPEDEFTITVMDTLHFASCKDTLRCLLDEHLSDVLLKQIRHWKTCARLKSAIDTRNTDMVAAILQNGFKPDDCDQNGIPFLFRAAESGSTEIVALFLKHGANPDSALTKAISASDDREYSAIAKTLMDAVKQAR